MMHNRLALSGQSAAMRKSRLEGKQSFLPKPRHAGSIDRLSAEIRRPSGVRSSSAEPPRATIGGGRLSREASATKIPMNRRSRSQQGEPARYGPGGPITPLRVNKYSRATTTPQRTPSEDRSNRNWQTSLDRALAFVTIKDHRPVSNPSWQRSECHRVQERLALRGLSGALIRPLTITRFVELTGVLLNALIRDTKLTNDNYVTKVPHLSKMLLYPGVVSKSWLKTVNTLHAFPHALALIAYLLDLVSRVEQPVEFEWMYAEKDDLAVYRRGYLIESWIRFQEPDHQFEDLNERYLNNVKLLLGNNEEKIEELMQEIKKYELCLEDASEQAARLDEARRNELRTTLLTSLRAEQAARLSVATQVDVAARTAREHAELLNEIENDIEKANLESVQLRKEVEEQVMSVSERTRLLDEVDYANRVHHSKSALAEQISKMILSKESELALWQKKTLESCVEYKQALIHLSAQYPDLAELAVDENELMEPACQAAVSAATTALRLRVSSLSDQLTLNERSRNALKRHRHNKLEETRTMISELKSVCSREAACLMSEQAAESEEAARWSALETELTASREALREASRERGGVLDELGIWESQEQNWCSKLSALNEYVKTTRATSKRTLEEAKQKRAMLICENVKIWHDVVDKVNEGAANNK